ncbi:MAG: DUF6172 family protein [Nibricoccus sp.]
MKKTFPLKRPGVADARVVDAVKFELRKYLKRERRKKFPEGFDQWNFACKVGSDQTAAATKAVEEVFSALDAIAQSGSSQVYVEILASAGKRFPANNTPVPPA